MLVWYNSRIMDAQWKRRRDKTVEDPSVADIVLAVIMPNLH